MKKMALFISALCLSMTSLADNYKILQMNTPSVKIGKQMCKVGDTFPDADPIMWSNDKQAIKAMNLTSKQIKLFAAKVFKDVEAKSIKDYYLKNSHLSTRGGVVSFSDLAEELSDTIYLYDTMQIESPVKIDSISSYLISYKQNGEMKWRTLASTDKFFFLSRELFEENDGQAEYTLTLYFRKKGFDDYMISDDIVIVLLPMSIDEQYK
jgi:hypothetical protein